MSELSFLVDLLLNHKLSTSVKKHIAERIREIEAKAQPASVARSTGVPAHLIGQAPSTVANLTNEPLAPAVSPIALTPAVNAQNRIVGGEVSTGHGTKGPRKF